MEDWIESLSFLYTIYPGLVVAIEANGRIVKMNANAAAYSQQSLSGLRLETMIHNLIIEEDLEMFERYKVQALADTAQTYRLRLHDDNRRILTWTVDHFTFFADRGIQGHHLCIRDISESVKQQSITEEIITRYHQLIDVYLDPIVIFKDLQIVFINEIAEETLGGTRENLLGEKIRRFVHPDYWDSVVSRLQTLGASDERTEILEIKVVNLKGEAIDVEVASKAISYEGEPAILTVLRNISARKKAEQEIIHMAYHDALTGLPNRRKFNQELSRMILERGLNQVAIPLFAVMVVDIDRFKMINDSLGHMYGDMFLQEMGRRIENGLSGCKGMLARMGGDEFTLLLEDCGGKDEMCTIAGCITKAIQQPFHLNEYEFYVTASIGIAVFPDDGGDAVELLKNADTAMYEVKKSGKNGYQFYTSGLNAQLKEKIELEGELRKAMKLNELLLHYQPQMLALDQRIIGVEALVRWNHPTKGLLPPNTFIPIAEESGLIYDMGTWILREACRQMRQWHDAGGPRIPVSVNLSTMQFHQSNLVEYIRKILEETGLEPQYLELEITESMMMDAAASTAILTELSTYGVKVNLDDFGTGYSSLSYLKHLPINKLKIDRSFITDLTLSESDRAIVATIISMARHLKMEVIAEGIETKEQLDFLLDNSCQEIQGYYFSRPLPANEVESTYFLPYH